MQKGAETLGIEAKRTGGRVVDCSGLENLAGNGGETPQTAGFSGSEAAQEATFAPCSEPSDGAYVGTLERWRTVEGWEAYQVSDLGRVRRAGRILKPAWAGSRNKQYLVCFLCDHGRRKSARVHCMVAAAFIGQRPPGLHTAHLDGNRSNCRLSNLAYLTPSANNMQKHEHGTMSQGEDRHNAVLTIEAVKEIRARARPYCPFNGYRALAREFGVRERQIHEVVTRKSWKQIP